MILYRKTTQLRIRRAAWPEAPFWCATILGPYSARRSTPVAIDYSTMRASGAERLEATVTEDVRDELDRAKGISAPVLIDAAESCEIVFRRGEDALHWCEDHSLSSVFLTSTYGTLPSRRTPETVLAICAWPLDLGRLTELFAEARGHRWGVAVPVIYPLTTDLPALENLAATARDHGAEFLAAMAVDAEPTARQAIAKSMNLGSEDDRYALLFHAPLEPLHLATERHIAALAHELGMADTIAPPNNDSRTNWNASAFLTQLASRMIAMELDLDLAGTLARSARLIAELDKPIARIAETARLSIIGGLDATCAEMLEEWLLGAEPPFAAFVNEQWRLRRAKGIS